MKKFIIISVHREGDNFYAMLMIYEEVILVVMIVVMVFDRVLKTERT